MRILIAESKTMAECATPVSQELLKRHRPELDSIASLFMNDWGKWTVEEIAGKLKISLSLAVEFKRMAYEFPNKSTGSKALEAYTGVVFRALDYVSLTEEEKVRADKTVNIISSLYGWLRGDDIVKPYRLDFTTRVAPTGETMAGYWKPLITPLLFASMRADGDDEILNLMPADAAKCLDWRKIKKSVSVVKMEFRSAADGGGLRTPHATLLKTLRGRLLRDIIRRDIRTLSGLLGYESETMYADPDTDLSSGKITLLCL